jgi:hypothetical protein
MTGIRLDALRLARFFWIAVWANETCSWGEVVITGFCVKRSNAQLQEVFNLTRHEGEGDS